MSNDLSDQTVLPDPYQDALLAGGLMGLAAIPIVGGAISTAVDKTLGHKQARIVSEGFVKVAARIRALEDRPTPAEMLASDEFTAACQATIDDLLRTAKEAKRARLAEALARMGPWGPFDEDVRAELFVLIERYSDLHVLVLKFFADPLIWITEAGGIGTESLAGGSVMSVLTRYVFPGWVDWQPRVTRVIDELIRDGLLENFSYTAGLSSREAMLSKRTSRTGDRFLQMVAEPGA